MCGINGIIVRGRINSIDYYKSKIVKMNSKLVHRGPDSDGTYCKENVFFGFRRLSILDLSEIANQPMVSDDGNVVLVFNGEIYNYIELLVELKKKGYNFKTKSDTEVIIQSYKEWGIDCVNKFNGMWAFALYDFQKGLFFSSRDRMGVKPFYYAVNDEYFVFSSETKSIVAAESFNQANLTRAYEYLAYGYNKTNDGETFYSGVKELLPGHRLLIKNNQVIIEKYYELTNDKVNFKNANEYSEYFKDLFTEALSIRYRSDVPVALLLSGGLDSSVIANSSNDLIKNGNLNQNKLIAYTAHFPNYVYDEFQIVNNYAKTLEHVELRTVVPDLNIISGEIENIIYGLDQPVQSFTTIVHYLLLKEIKKDGIKVALNGQGADEAFYGYDRYIIGCFLLDELLKTKGQFLKQYGAIRNNLNYTNSYIFLQLLKSLLTKRTASFLRAKFQEHTLDVLSQNFIRREKNHFTSQYKFSFSGSNLLNYTIDHIKNTGLNSILHYEDVSSMLNSVEMRSPFMDYRIMEFAYSIPDSEKFDLGITKKIIRNTLGNRLPKEIVNNYNKIGFNTPFSEYVKSDSFGKVIDNILSSSDFSSRNIWDSKKLKYIFNNIDEFPSFPLWRFINYEIWLRVNKITNV